MAVHKKTDTLPVTARLDITKPLRSTSDVSKWRSALSSADNGTMKSLFDLYEDLLIDGVLSDAADKRILAVTNSELVFLDKAGKEVDTVRDMIDTPAFEDMLQIIMQRRFWGRCGMELGFSENGLSVAEIPKKHIDLDKKIIRIQQSDSTGVDYTNDDSLVVLGKSTDHGLFLKTAPYAIYKRGGFGDYAQWLEIFGMPQRIGKYSSQDTDTRTQLEEAFRTAGTAPWMVIPKEAEVETVNNTGNNGGGGSSYNDFRKACNEEMLITILGQTMTTIQGDKGARSLGEVHKEVEEGKNRSDLRFVQRVLNYTILPILQKRGLAPEGNFAFPKAAQSATVDELLKLSNIIGIPARWVHEKFGIPEPDGKEPIARAQAVAAPKEDPPKEDPPKDDPPKQGDKKIKNSDESKFFQRLADFFVKAPGNGAHSSNYTITLMERISGKINLSSNYNINVSKLFKEALKTIYAQAKAGEEFDLINQSLFDITNEPLQQAFTGEFVKKGADFGKTNAAFINEFSTNGAVFSAFKNHQQTKEIVALLVDDKGGLLSFSKFRKAAQEVGGKYNMQYLQTEYNTAVRSARSAANYKKYQETADLYPNLEYMESTSANKRDSHLAYVGTILPIDDPWWDDHMPPSDWNCGCWVSQTDAKATASPDGELVNPLFASNPGKTGEFIKIKDHPYVKDCSPKEQKAVIKEVKSLTKKK